MAPYYTSAIAIAQLEQVLTLHCTVTMTKCRNIFKKLNIDRYKLSLSVPSTSTSL